MFGVFLLLGNNDRMLSLLPECSEHLLVIMESAGLIWQVQKIEMDLNK